MCAQGRPDEDEHGIRIHAGRYSDAYLQRASWQLGYTIVVWRGRHVAEPTELDAQEASGYWLKVLQVASALQRHYRPVKMNYQTLGNAVPHLHTHLLPRFAQDPAPGRPRPFPEGERPKLPEETVRRDTLALRAMARASGTRWVHAATASSGVTNRGRSVTCLFALLKHRLGPLGPCWVRLAGARPGAGGRADQQLVARIGWNGERAAAAT